MRERRARAAVITLAAKVLSILKRPNAHHHLSRRDRQTQRREEKYSDLLYPDAGLIALFTLFVST